MKIKIILGLGFGDEGKGTICDHIARTTSASLVVRFSGGAQCGHNVVTPDGRHHTFAQFGSGTFAGARTHLSRFMLVNPVTLMNEAIKLEELSCKPFDVTTIEREALVTNFFQMIANQAREVQRGKNRHGSCGMGIGETVSDAIKYPEMAIRIKDIETPEVLRKKLTFSRDLKREEFGNAPEGIDAFHPFSDDRIDYYVGLFQKLASMVRVVDESFLTEELQKSNTVIFEGAQGVLLDQDYGFHPYTTWSNTTFDNALDLLRDFDGEVTKVGVLRGYMTRHGAGPFPTEIDNDNPPESAIRKDVHNQWGRFQEGFRLGHFDAVLARYALEVIGGVDELAITNLDKLGPLPRFCSSYDDGIIRQISRLRPKKLDAWMLENYHPWTSSIQVFKPNYETLQGRVQLVERIAHELNAPVKWCSIGPKATDKIPVEALTG